MISYRTRECDVICILHFFFLINCPVFTNLEYVFGKNFTSQLHFRGKEPQKSRRQLSRIINLFSFAMNNKNRKLSPIPVFLHTLNSLSFNKCFYMWHRGGSVIPPNYREGLVIPPPYRKGSVIPPNFRERSDIPIPPNFREGSVSPPNYREGSVITPNYREGSFITTTLLHSHFLI